MSKFITASEILYQEEDVKFTGIAAFNQINGFKLGL